MNQVLDSLARRSVLVGDRWVPGFSVCGFVGCCLGLVAVMLLTLITGLSVAVVAGLCAICGLSYASLLALRQWLRLGDAIVLMEHVWWGLALLTVGTHLLDLETRSYLDVITVGVSLGLSCGRVGCLVGGCCHGLPSRWGILYPEGSWGDPASHWRNGLRLFPVQLLESAALLLTAMGAVVLVLVARPGAALTWFLVAYAVSRFSLEALRGDRRPHWLGISQARWMSAAQFCAALVIDPAWRWDATHLLAEVVLVVVVAAGVGYLAFRRSRDGFSLANAAELRSTILTIARELSLPSKAAEGGEPEVHVHELASNLAVVVEWLDPGRSLRASIRDREERSPRELCRVVAVALPEIDAATSVMGGASVLHVVVPWPIVEESLGEDTMRRAAATARGDWIYAWTCRKVIR